MAASKYSCFLSLMAVLCLYSTQIRATWAARQLLQTEAPIPSLPKATLPPFPAISTGPQPTLPTLPPLPTVPTLPKPTLPPPPPPATIPAIPTTFPSIPFPSPPPSN